MTSPRPRHQDIALITEQSQSAFGYPEDQMIRRLFDKLGWSAFTDEAIAELADHYAWNAADRERRNAENRRTARSSERHDHSEQEAA